MAAPREPETRQLIERLHRRGRRRARLRLLLAGLGGAVVLTALVTVVVLATGAAGAGEGGPTTSSRVSVSTTHRTTTTGTVSETTTTAPRTTSTTEGTTSSTARTTTTGSGTTSTTAGAASGGSVEGKVVVIDPGHQARADPALEPVGPGSTEMKAKVSSGTASVATGMPESELTLAVGLKLRDALKARGVKVVMTRTAQDVDISNIARAQIGNSAHAHLTVRLHANGSDDPSVHGLFTLYPATTKGWTDDIATVSKKAAAIVQRDLIAATGAQDRGLQPRSDLTGFNWSDVPSILVEMGFMTNVTEDKQLRSAAYQDKIVQGLVRGIVEFLSAS